MSNLNIDQGIKEYTINNKATLRFNPSDPEMYKRFSSTVADIEHIGKEMMTSIGVLSGSTDAGKALSIISNADKKVKECLTRAFGEDNDFNDIFEGVSSFAGTDTGEWVITNFLNAIRPEIEASTEQRMKIQAQAAQANREQRRAERKV